MDSLLRKLCRENELAGSIAFRHNQIRLRGTKKVIGASAFLFIVKGNHNGVALTRDTGMADTLVTELGTQIGCR